MTTKPDGMGKTGELLDHIHQEITQMLKTKRKMPLPNGGFKVKGKRATRALAGMTITDGDEFLAGQTVGKYQELPAEEVQRTNIKSITRF